MNLSKLTQNKNLTDTEQLVLQYIVEHLDTALAQGVRSIAHANYTSTSTIMRLARKMGYSGFVDMCYKLRPLVEEPQQLANEEQTFLESFCTSSLLNYNTYDLLKQCARRMSREEEDLIFIYATGFSATVGNYMARKLVNMGKRCIFASGEDSVGMFENNLDRMGIFFCISKSGETPQVRDKIRTARENGVFTAAITGEEENSISRYAGLWFRVKDLRKLDDLDITPNTFFPQSLMLVELIAYEYLRACKRQSEDGPKPPENPLLFPPSPAP